MIRVIALMFFALNCHSLEFKELVECPNNKNLIVDSVPQSGSSHDVVDMCSDSSLTGNDSINYSTNEKMIDTVCPEVTKELVNNIKGLPQIKINSGLGIVFEYFLLRKLKFKKVYALGRDQCIGYLPKKDLRKLEEFN